MIECNYSKLTIVDEIDELLLYFKFSFVCVCDVVVVVIDIGGGRKSLIFVKCQNKLAAHAI